MHMFSIDWLLIYYLDIKTIFLYKYATVDFCWSRRVRGMLMTPDAVIIRVLQVLPVAGLLHPVRGIFYFLLT